LFEGALESASVGAVVGGGTGALMSLAERKDVEKLTAKDFIKEQEKEEKPAAKLEDVSTDVAKKTGISVKVTPEMEGAVGSGLPAIEIKPEEVKEVEAALEKSTLSEERRADIIRRLEAPEPVVATKEEKPTTETVKEESPVIEPQITAQPEVQAPKEAETTRSVSTDGTGEEKTPPVISPSDKELSDRAVMSQWHKAETGKPVTVTAWHVEGDKSKTGLMPDAREKLGRETELGEGWYGARDKDIAETYGKGAKQYKVKLTNPYVIRTMDRRHALNNLSNEKLKEIIDAGHDGILVTTPKANYSSGDRGQVQVVKFSAAKAKPTEKPLTQEVKPSKPEDFDTAEEYVASKGRPLWHGSNTEIEKFDPSMLGKSTGAKSAEHGFFLTNDFEEALGYGDIATGKKGEGIKVTKAWADLKNPKIIDFKGKDYPEGEINKLVLEAKKEGHDGAILKKIVDSPLVIEIVTKNTVVFDASKIKTKPQLTAEFNAAKAKQAEKPLTSEVKEKAPVAEKGEVKPSEEKKITPPAFREWRFTKTASNSGNILPNKVGTKFTQDQVNELVAWAEANGMSVTRPTTTVIHVIGDTGTPISLSMMGAYGVKQEKLKAKDEIRKAEEERKRIERKEKAEGAESSKWIDSTFGVGTMNDFNKIELADFLEGRKENFGGIMSPKWVDGFKKIDAVSNVGIVDWNKVKKAYQDSKPEAKVEPVKDNNPFKNEFEPVKVWSIKISNRQGDSYSLSYNLKPEQGGGAVIEYLGEITSKEKLERINFLNGRSSLKTIKEEINDNPVREAKVEEKPITEEQDEDIQRSEQAETVTAERPIFNKDDIDLRQATQAYTAISHSPERRAEQERQDYVEHLNAVYDGFLKIAKSNEQKKILNEEIERYRQGYLSHRKAVLSAKSRTMSAMIVGPAKFPSSRNQKRLDTEMKRNDELIEWSKKAQKSMEKRILAQGVQEAGGETEVLKKQIADAEKFQQQMRDSNAAIRKGKTDDEKVAGVVATGLPEKIARELLKPDFMGRFGFADYQMTSNNAKIKRMKEKLAGFEKQDAATPEDTKELKFEGGVILDNVADDRVQIIYDAKPDEKVRLSLRGRGFLWSPKNGAWQRKRTTSALYDAMNLTGAKESSKATSMTPDQSIESISKGEANTIVTQKDYRDTVDRINSKMRRLSANPMADPELWADLLKAGVFHVERGGRTFAAWSERMVYEFGEAIRPHLDNIWKGVTNDAPVTDIPPVPTKLPQGDKTAKAASLLEGSKPKTAQTQTGKESGTRVQQGSTTPVLESQTGMQEQQKALGEAVSVSSNENIAQKEQNIKQSRVFQRAKAKYEGLQSSSDVTYDVKTLEDQIARAMDMSEKDPVRFKKIALGHMNAPEGVTDTAINIVYSEKMLEEGNGAEAFRAIRNHSLKQTERGQEIAMENARATNVNDAQAFIQKVIEAKMMNAGKKLYEFSTREKSGSSKKAATEKIKQEVRRVKEIVDSKQLDIAEAQKLIDELGCK